MTCACGMDSVGTCLVCGVRLCPEHTLRGPGLDLIHLVRNQLGVSWEHLLHHGIFPIDLNGVRSDLRPLFRFSAQRQAFCTALRKSGVICWNCRVNSACRAAGATPQPTAPALGAGGSQRLRDAAASYILGDQVAWDSMASNAALKDALFQDLIHLARKKAKRLQAPMEWEAVPYVPHFRDHSSGPHVNMGKVLATEEVFYVVDATGSTTFRPWDGDGPVTNYFPIPLYMNRHGQWGKFKWENGKLMPPARPKVVTIETGLLERLWSGKRMVFRVSWSDTPPQPGLGNILKRAAELLAPAA